MSRSESEQPIQRVLLHYAMSAEAADLVGRLGLRSERALHRSLPARIRSGRVGSVEVTHCTNGLDDVHKVDRVGLEAAAVTAWCCLSDFEADLYVNAGTCGGFTNRGAIVGRSYLGNRFLYHDHRIPLPGFREMGEARIPGRAWPAIEGLLEVETGPISSGSSLDTTDAELEFFEREGVVAKDMEATAIAAVCQDAKVPFMALKTVTDLVDHPEPSQDQFLRNLASSADRLTDQVEALLVFLGRGVTLGQLGESGDGG